MSTFAFGVVACAPTPPDSREPVTLAYTDSGDAVRGQSFFEAECIQCHKLQLGQNQKGPQLLGIYGAKAGQLEDYNYSDAMRQSNWIWDTATLDTYIADAIKALPETRMQADPITDTSIRQDIIAYLATLHALPASTTPDVSSN